MTKRGELPTAEGGGNPEAIAGDCHGPTTRDSQGERPSLILRHDTAGAMLWRA